MTAVGKILVFFNLLLSIATAALIVLVFVTRTNWKTQYEEAVRLARVAETAYKAERQDRQTQVQNLENDLTQARADVLAAQNERDYARGEVLKLQTERDNYANLHEEEKTKTQLMTAELNRIKDERSRLEKEKQDLQQQVVQKTQETNDAKAFQTEAEIARDAAQERNERLLEQFEQVAKENRDLRAEQNRIASGLPVTGSSVLAAPVPDVPKDISASVTAVTPNGIVEISAGSDQGIIEGAILDVYRMVPENPSASRYLGRLTISRAEPKAAVGNFRQSLKGELPVVGDQVSNILLGSGQ
jgi:hypothetical protein